MKTKRFMKIVSVILVCVLTLGTLVYAKDNSSDKEDKFYEKQMKSIEKYNMLQSNNKSKKGFNHNVYGGAYIDDEGELVVLLKEDSKANREKVKDLTGDQNIKVKKCEVTYDELLQVIDTMNNKIEQLKNQDIYIDEMFDDIINGKVMIYVRDFTKEKEEVIKTIVDEKFVDILSSKGQIENQSTDLKGGYTIKSLDNSASSTISFGATRNGVDGVVISGHAGNFIGEKFSYGGETIGDVTATAYSNNSTADAAFIETKSSFNVTDDVISGDIIGGITTDLPVGTTILMYGKTSGLQSGKIKSYNFSATSGSVTITDCVLADYTSAHGDSGGPVYIREIYNLYSIIGNHRGTATSTGYAVYSKYENIASELGITVKH